jgi:hypothetical protein
LSVLVETGDVLDHREQERVARPGNRLQRLHSLAGLQWALPTRLIRFPLADPQKTPYRRAHIWSRQHDSEDEFHKKDQDYESHN